ncbi:MULTISPECIES: Flp family type IVb pilin [Pseudarthrobacter]|uniref:Pilus assembly protein Flp/PilA n=1 Tax=Pseudarthrobacter niigatensis TaxID=369935 RepID=A0AAJ1SY87_9MICC|nr:MULTISPECIES: Flp family type IVb pilin [Pseudarthrobacter]MDQ0147904.1 pilus assembly protein Flp/PilA [Pseudarthrobacter niigatensis]MDQ0268014.1 pilus assembly protein Flp/PilA [Pseudarthrobacter niigatensis]NUT69822.1 Flp family type IVb pilin [Pseudarthrobacter sp. C4D7]
MTQLVQALWLIRSFTQRLRAEEDGATATEYGITVGFIAIVIVAGVGLFGLSLNGFFDHLTTGLKAALGLP